MLQGTNYIHLFHYIGLLADVNAQDCSDITVTVNIARSYVDEDTEFTCTFSCTGRCEYTSLAWIKLPNHSVYAIWSGGDHTYPPYDGRIETNMEDGEHTLTLKDTQLDDDGQWECRIMTESCNGGRGDDKTLSVSGKGYTCHLDTFK